MSVKNRYFRNSRISEAKFRQLVKHFSLDIEANKTAALTRLNRNTVNRYYMLLRKFIADYCMKDWIISDSVLTECAMTDTTSANGDYKIATVPSFIATCLMDGKVYTEIIPSNLVHQSRQLIDNDNSAECFIDWCRWNRYVGLVDLGTGRHHRINRQDRQHNHTKSLFKISELFWGFSKSRLMKFNGIRKSTLYLHLKECEFRFNYRNDDLYKRILAIILSRPTAG